jgi:plastocyanin
MGMCLATAAACGGSTSPQGSGAPVGVTIQDFSFSLAALTIKAGMSVRWTNNGPSQHTTTSDDGLWNSTTLGAPSGGGAYGGGTA